MRVEKIANISKEGCNINSFQFIIIPKGTQYMRTRIDRIPNIKYETKFIRRLVTRKIRVKLKAIDRIFLFWEETQKTQEGS